VLRVLSGRIIYIITKDNTEIPPARFKLAKDYTYHPLQERELKDI